jgi:hypothetical protein
MSLDPHNKAVIDHLLAAQERKRSQRGWIVWLTVLAVSLGCLYLFNHGLVSGRVGTALAIAGIIGVLLFLVFLSTKPFGRSDSSIRWWWLR